MICRLCKNHNTVYIHCLIWWNACDNATQEPCLCPYRRNNGSRSISSRPQTAATEDAPFGATNENHAEGFRLETLISVRSCSSLLSVVNAITASSCMFSTNICAWSLVIADLPSWPSVAYSRAPLQQVLRKMNYSKKPSKERCILSHYRDGPGVASIIVYLRKS